MEFEGKVALVTGASRRIGAAVALALGQRGGSVVVNYLSGKDRAEHVAAQVEAAGGQALVLGADVRNRSSVREMVKRAVEKFGRLDFLINNARHLHLKKSFLELDWEKDMCSQLEVHL